MRPTDEAARTDVIEELKEVRESSQPERRTLKCQRRTEAIERMKSFEVTIPEFNVDETSNKHVIWCVSNCYPFKRFLHQICEFVTHRLLSCPVFKVKTATQIHFMVSWFHGPPWITERMPPQKSFQQQLNLLCSI